jgi:hypothetical protein
MNEEEHLKNLSDIKNLMERSSRFPWLSGFSGIFIGLYGIIGALAAWWYVGNNSYEVTSYYNLATSSNPGAYGPYLTFFMVDALLVLLLSLTTGYILMHRFAKKRGLNLWDASAKRLLINLFMPLSAGGIYCLILLQHHQFGLIAPSMLMFYGLSLLNASKYTYNDIRYMGMLEVILGLIAAVRTGYGLLFWAIGFGVLHIIYGITMYYKYER